MDDEPIDCAFFARTLESAGYTVVTADNHATAVSAFETIKSEIKLLIADVALPGKNGIELAKTLLARIPELRVLFVSGYVGAHVARLHGSPEGDRWLLEKPFRASVLVQRVQEIPSVPQSPDWIIS